MGGVSKHDCLRFSQVQLHDRHRNGQGAQRREGFGDDHGRWCAVGVGIVPLLIGAALFRRAQHIEGGRLRRLGGRRHGMALQLVLVAPDAGLDLVQGRVERAVGVAAQAVTLQVLTRGQRDHTVHAKAVAFLADDHFSIAAAIEIFSDTGQHLVGDPRSQGLPDVDMFAGNLNLHEGTANPSRWEVKRGDTHARQITMILDRIRSKSKIQINLSV